MDTQQDGVGRLVFIAERGHLPRLTMAEMAAAWGRPWEMGEGPTLRRLREFYGPWVPAPLNLLPPDGECGTWHPQLARLRARQLAAWARETGRRLALLGRRVADAFGAEGDFGSILLGAVPMLLLPHPSGRSRVANSADRVEELRRALSVFRINFCEE